MTKEVKDNQIPSWGHVEGDISSEHSNQFPEEVVLVSQDGVIYVF